MPPRKLTSLTSPTSLPKPTRGRPPLPPQDRRVTVNATIGPATRTYLERVGGGSASRGLRLVLDHAARVNLSPEPAKTTDL